MPGLGKLFFAWVLFGMLLLAATPSAPAMVILQDNFDNDNGGSGALNHSGFAHWTVTTGTVDLIGNGFFDLYPGSGLYVDLDGTSLQAGLLQSQRVFDPGTYVLSFTLGGSRTLGGLRRHDTNIVTVWLGDYVEIFTLVSDDPLALFTRHLTTHTMGPLSFQNAGGDTLGAILANVSVATAGPAMVILQDNFDNDNGGSGALNHSGFAHWTVTTGTVDLIGNGFFDLYPGSGLYVDLDGTSLQAGLLQSQRVFDPGTYVLSFTLGGSRTLGGLRRHDTNIVTVWLGDYVEIFTLVSDDPLALFTRHLTTHTMGPLSFQNAGGDTLGAILANVSVVDASATTSVVDASTTVPEPSTYLMFATGLTGLLVYGWLRRQRAA